MESVYGEHPPGLSDAEAGVGYLRAVIEELESLERDLPRLLRLEWRSEAADAFTELLFGCVRRVGQTAGDYQAAAEVLQGYANELRLLDAGDWS